MGCDRFRASRSSADSAANSSAVSSTAAGGGVLATAGVGVADVRPPADGFADGFADGAGDGESTVESQRRTASVVSS
jgi:hypothetical protein